MSTTLRLFALSLLVLLLFLAAAVLAQGWLHRQHERVQTEAVETKRRQLAAAVEATAHRPDQWSPAHLATLGQLIDATVHPESAKPTVTEVSACLLTGIVPTDSHQTSGGVHNYPRLLEQWSGTGLYIRGSMVAMFTSEVATEPWSIRVYTGAGRYWGLHQSLRDADHDVPLEPVVLNAQRLHYKEISKSEYATLKATIEALPN